MVENVIKIYKNDKVIISHSLDHINKVPCPNSSK